MPTSLWEPGSQEFTPVVPSSSWRFVPRQLQDSDTLSSGTTSTSRPNLGDLLSCPELPGSLRVPATTHLNLGGRWVRIPGWLSRNVMPPCNEKTAASFEELGAPTSSWLHGWCFQLISGLKISFHVKTSFILFPSPVGKAR